MSLHGSVSTLHCCHSAAKDPKQVLKKKGGNVCPGGRRAMGPVCWEK